MDKVTLAYGDYKSKKENRHINDEDADRGKTRKLLSQ